MMPLQRVRDAENRMRNKSSNGPLRVQSNAQGSRESSCYSHLEKSSQSILQRAGIR